MNVPLLKKSGGVHVIWMERHPLDVMTSRHRGHKKEESLGYYVTPLRYAASAMLQVSLRGLAQVTTINYETLVKNPEEVQLQLERVLGEKASCDLKDAHNNYAMTATPQAVEAMNSPRPLDPSSCGRWKTEVCNIRYLARLMDYHPQLFECFRRAGYPLALEELQKEVAQLGLDLPPPGWRPAMAVVAQP